MVDKIGPDPGFPDAGSGRGGKRILEHISWVAVLTLGVKAAGFVEKMALAYYFGTSKEMDAFWIAQSVPMMAFLACGAVVGPTILPMFVRRGSEGDRAGAWGQLKTWMAAFATVLVVCSAVVLFLSDTIVGFLAPGFDASLRHRCTSMLWWLLPSIVLLGLLPLWISVLNAEKRFAVPPVAQVFLKAVPLVAIVLFAARIGMTSALVGFVIASLCAFLICLYHLRRSWPKRGGPIDFSDPDFRKILILMAAPAVGIFFSQLGTIVENRACSQLGGGTISAFQFARKLTNFPLLIVPFATGTVLYTYFAQAAHRKDPETATRLLTVGVRFMLFLFIPLALLTVLFASPVVSIVYERGSFDSDSRRVVATALAWLAPTMIFFAVETLIMRHFYSRADLWAPTYIGIACVILRVALIWTTVKRLGLVGIAFSILLSRLCKLLLLFALTSRRARLPVGRFEPLEAVKILVAAAAAGVFVKMPFLHLVWNGSFSSGRTIGLLAAAAGSFTVVYLAAAFVLSSQECRTLLNGLRGWRR